MNKHLNIDSQVIESLDSYGEIFSTLDDLSAKKLKYHVEHLKKLDNLYPPNNSFFMLVNSSTKKYEYITKNFDSVVGLSRTKMNRFGLYYWFTHFKLKELQVGMKMLSDIVTYGVEKLSEEDRCKMNCSWSHRLRIKSGQWINILNNVTPIIFDKEGKPVVTLCYYTKVGEGEKLPLTATIRLLNDHKEYETVWHKNYSRELIESTLTNRERDILRLLAQGNSSKEIGDKLFISSHTVDTHRRSILKKLSLQSTTEIISNYNVLFHK